MDFRQNTQITTQMTLNIRSVYQLLCLNLKFSLHYYIYIYFLIMLTRKYRQYGILEIYISLDYFSPFPFHIPSKFTASYIDLNCLFR